MKTHNNILTIMKKECSRVFRDKTLFFGTVVLPGVMMFAIYFFMGTFMGELFSVDEDYVYQVHAVNLPASAAELLAPEELRINLIHATAADIPRIKQEITDRETDALLIFPENFDALVAEFDVATATVSAPNVQIWSNMARSESQEAAALVQGVLYAYHHSLTHRFSINAPSEYALDGNYDLATDADIFAMVVGFMMPMMFMIFLFSGCVALAPESIAGEKERGTLGSVLVTPASRTHMALGKILGIAIFTLLSALGSLLGTILAVPYMMDMEFSGIMESYSVGDLLLLVLVAVTTTLVFVSLLSLISAYAKSVKEANANAQPVMILVIVLGLSGLLFGGAPSEVGFYFIPIVNSALSITAIFDAGNIIVANVLVTCAVNVVIALGLTAVLAVLFSSEKIVFDK
ncbi:MAG: ABC transporter permease subunit [Defluviitaleaceae bacterium]|nr:ABC transporter permease subunit [Defluviitaleaceae bacterium]